MNSDKKGRKDDAGKLDWTLIPFKELEGTVKVLQFGAEKYGRENWKSVSDGLFRYRKALMRHVVEYINNPTILDESGESHLSHIICNALFLLHLEGKDENETRS